MRMLSSKRALALAALLAAAPVSVALADTATTANTAAAATTVTTATAVAGASAGMAQPVSTGVYDNLDKYRTNQGFPQPGWQFLNNPPN